MEGHTFRNSRESTFQEWIFIQHFPRIQMSTSVLSLLSQQFNAAASSQTNLCSLCVTWREGERERARAR